MSRDILLDDIQPDPEQPRKNFDAERLNELAQSMGAIGLAVPILLRPVDDGYIIVHGERRWRAAGLLGWDAIPAEIRGMTEEEAHMLALIENVQRDDLSPVEEARAYKGMLAMGMTQKQLGEQIGKSQSAIATKLRLLKLPDGVQAALNDGRITEGHAKQLLRLVDVSSVNTTAMIEDPMPAVAHLRITVDILIVAESQTSRFSDLIDLIKKVEAGELGAYFANSNQATIFLFNLERRAGALLNMVKNAFDDGVEEGNFAAYALENIPLSMIEAVAKIDPIMRTHRDVGGIDFYMLVAEYWPDEIDDDVLNDVVEKFNDGPRDLPMEVWLYDQAVEYVT